MAATPTPSLTLAETRESLIGAVAAADYFALAYIQLCGLSYWPNPAQIPQLVADPSQVTPWGDGRWACIWGPALDDEEANLVYVAAYYDKATGLPVAAVVVVRGTDVTDDIWGDLKEAFEDLDVPFQYPLPWLSGSAARVAGGTLDALTTIEGFTSGGRTLRQFLAGFLGNPANEKPVLVVTGHSLGGCVATVLAPWLQWSLATGGVNVPTVPATFAAPTAGNAAFAQYFGSTFQYAPRYFNTLDAVPCGWADIDRIKTIYDQNGLSTPEIIKLTLDGFQFAIREGGASYAQPACLGELNGYFCLGFDWYQQISTQHDHRTYIALMQGQAPQCFLSTQARKRRYSHEDRTATLGAAAEAAAAPPGDAAQPPNPVA